MTKFRVINHKEWGTDNPKIVKADRVKISGNRLIGYGPKQSKWWKGREVLFNLEWVEGFVVEENTHEQD